MRRSRAGALACLIAPLLAAPLAAAAPPAPLEPRLARALAGPLPAWGVPVRVSLVERDLPAPGAARRTLVRARRERVLAALPAGAFRVGYRYESLAAVSGAAQPAAIEALRRHPEVRSLHLDGERRAALAQGRGLVGADGVHAQGVTGAGIQVAVLDTGIDRDHPDLADDLVAERCFCDAHPSPAHGACCPNGSTQQSGAGAAEDDNGHGTSVSGIVTSRGLVAPVGVAPDAGIVAVKVLGAGGGGQDSGIDAGLDWVLTNHAALGIRVVNLSLSDGGEYDSTADSACSGDPTATAITALAAAGVAVFAASGNDGHDAGISSPACVAEAISVGGVYDASLGSVGWCGSAVCSQSLCTDASGPDVFVCHSNSGSLLDLLAPDWRTTTSALGGGTTHFGGTSAAAPYAAAEAALLLDVEPSLAPAQLRTLMKAYGPLVGNPDNGLAFRRASVSDAVAAVVATQDPDADGLPNASDPCPTDPTNDADGDGICGGVDACPLDAANDADGDGTCGDVDACPLDPDDDADGDGACGDVDPCPLDAANDADGDGTCGDVDACPLDPANDADADGLCADADNCPAVANPDQADANGNGAGDACDPLAPAAVPALSGRGLAALVLLLALAAIGPLFAQARGRRPAGRGLRPPA